jgi:drug/metabolite transporter (DMT)-like permease
VLTDRRTALFALAAAGTLWGLTVPLSKLALEWLGPAWLTVARFAVAAPLLALVARGRLRAALTPGIALAGALGYGGVILLQNAGIARTSVSHAALIVGAVPVLVALIAAAVAHAALARGARPAGRAAARPAAWAGYAIAIAGLALVAGAGGSGATPSGDLLVLASVAGSAGFIVAQPRLLAGRDPAAVTAVQLAAGALAVLPAALVAEGVPPLPQAGAPLAAWAGLALAGTALPFWLFAFGQARVNAELAGAFVNLEPLVGAAAGWIAYQEAVSAAQLGGGAAILAGIALSALAGGRAAGGRAAPTGEGGRPTRAAVGRTRRRWPAPEHEFRALGTVSV